ncbi:type VI secretion system-associated FHA domain protein TagH [Sagittula sp. MA-2]|jgi:type VI secretion system FHA domain protein|uniref:type VI secretion system-associated FHA domain protein TagH n=1 Tax=Sagittula sp. MA-2 TaxID=3048007 RepID=UPI0024C3215A|nr:type VI secretion system-associated FHA domain protein TagH [Sagittula sp. MA-2]WHZ37990.1 type VI secretion system-associated FHA domain protein TagH [Sagittula sp. MA-2]
MTLVLRIENFDQLENGGPTSLRLDGHGASVGRRASMDWSLPDPSKMISGHHFDITFEGGTYYLTDVSMNGTFVDGQRHRLEGKLALRGGERLIVGHYIVGVEVQQAAGAAAPDPDDDPWGAFGSPNPSNMQPVSGGRGAGLDALNDGFIQVQRPSASAGLKTETSLQLPMHNTPVPGSAPSVSHNQGSLQTPSGWGPPQQPAPPQHPSEPQPAYVPTLGRDGPQEPARPPERHAPPPGDVPPYTPSLGQDVPQDPHTPAYQPSLGQETPPPSAPANPPQARQMPQHEDFSPEYRPPEHPPEEPRRAMSPSQIPMPRPMPPQPSPSAQPRPEPRPVSPQPAAPAPGPAPSAAGGGGDVGPALRAFCEGAGLDPKAVKSENAVQLMHMLGRCVRIATEETMMMLKARADVKNFTRGGVRTMLSANANNPMKFMPDSQQALELMFVAPRDGFMMGPDSFKDALGDIRQHQEAVFRALQPALAEVFRGLSPEEIEAACESTGSNLLGGKRSGKQWPTYVERWDEKAQAGEHGILDAFLQAFAKAYAEANNRK